MESKSKIKILFIPDSTFPVPSTKGGAFTTLITDIMKKNEEYQNFDISVISRDDEQAVLESQMFKYSRVFYVLVSENQEKEYRRNKIINFINKIGFKVLGQRLIAPPYVQGLLRAISGEDFDFIFIAGGEPSDYGALTRKYGKEKMIFNVGGHLSGGKVVEKNYEYFICCSNYIAELLGDNHLITNKRIFPILNCVDTQLFRQKLDDIDRVNLSKKYNIKENEKTILFMGRISREKGIKELILAFKIMRNRDRCKLLIVGDGNFGYGGENPFENELKKIISDITDRIVFTGFIHHSSLWKIMKMCDFGVLPSTWEEPAGNVVPEAMAAGIPLIITNSGGMPEYVTEETAIIVNKENDLVSNLAKEMDFLCENPDKCVRMGKLAEEMSAKYDMSVYYEKLVEVFKNCHN